MVEARSLPGRCRMTYRAILRESGGYVVRVLRAIVIAAVAGNTFLGFAPVDLILMAIYTSQRCVASGQRVLSRRRVVEARSPPPCRVVTFRTGLGEERC